MGVAVRVEPQSRLSQNFSLVVDAIRATEAAQGDEIRRAGQLLASTVVGGGTILACGNGGSAADSQHFVAELTSSYQLGLARPSIPAIALTTNSSVITAYANDFGFDNVFARQVEGLGRPGDCLVAISTSGLSRNVVNAASAAIDRGMSVVSLQGAMEGALARYATVAIRVPSTDTQAIQAVHIVIEHYLCEVIEAAVVESAGEEH